MRNLFSIDNPVMNFLAKVLDSILLNMLWFVFSIPLVTAGASTAALYYCALKLAEDRPVSILRDFVRAFRDNLRTNMKLSLFMLVTGAIIAVDGYVFWHMRLASAAWTIGAAFFVLILIFYGILSLYVYPLMARFENEWKITLKNALVIGIRFLICTFLMAGIHVLIAFLAVKVFTPVVFLGEGFAALLDSYLLKNIFRMLEQQADTAA